MVRWFGKSYSSQAFTPPRESSKVGSYSMVLSVPCLTCLKIYNLELLFIAAETPDHIDTYSSAPSVTC